MSDSIDPKIAEGYWNDVTMEEYRRVREHAAAAGLSAEQIRACEVIARETSRAITELSRMAFPGLGLDQRTAAHRFVLVFALHAFDTAVRLADTLGLEAARDAGDAVTGRAKGN